MSLFNKCFHGLDIACMHPEAPDITVCAVCVYNYRAAFDIEKELLASVKRLDGEGGIMSVTDAARMAAIEEL